MICYSTCDRVEYDRESKERAYGEKVLFVDRSLSKVATELKEQKEHRCYVGLEGGKLAQQSEYCCCSGCRSTPSFCLHNDVTEHNNPWIVDMAMGTRSTFQVLGDEKITTIKYKKKYKKEPRQIESTSTEDKQIKRQLTETSVEQGKLVFVNDNYEKKDVKERSLVVFTGDQANVSGDRKWEFGRVLENIKAGATQVKVKRVDMKNKWRKR